MVKKILNVLNNPKIVTLTPIICSFLFEYANIGQIARIWSEHTAAGHNLFSWIVINISLWLYLNFYRVCAPKEKFAMWVTFINIICNNGLIFSIVWWRYIVK